MNGKRDPITVTSTDWFFRVLARAATVMVESNLKTKHATCLELPMKSVVALAHHPTQILKWCRLETSGVG